MHEIKTEIHNFSVIFPAQRWLHESRMTTTFIPMGGNFYRLNEGFLCGPISFGDVIEALPTGQKDVVLYRRRVKRAGLKRACYIMPRDMAEKPGFAELMKDQRSRWICGSRFQRGFPCVLAQDLQPGRKS